MQVGFDEAFPDARTKMRTAPAKRVFMPDVTGGTSLEFIGEEIEQLYRREGAMTRTVARTCPLSLWQTSYLFGALQLTPTVGDASLQ